MFNKRWWKYWWQRRTRGWDDSDTWDIRFTMAKFIIPRLKRFKEITQTCPVDLTEQEWDDILDKMILSFNLVLKEYECDHESLEEIQKDYYQVKEGIDLFAEYFQSLWD